MMLIIFVIALLFLFGWLIIRKFKMLKNRKKHEIDEKTIENVLKQLTLDLKENNFRIVQQKYIGDIWGRNIELYNLIIQSKKDENLRHKIEKSLSNYCKQHNLINKYGTMIRISDFWYKDNQLELDLVLLVNDKTKEYLDDIHRI